ncbi:hypothetical protein LRAMOSA10389 [Lichtheimia ramosa]|uniref:Major facilitator superfamily (MFS) profile domain-containing protein n=1 Tax=Lichtheimia ramosa TaxID=688394 RepID=A0A077WPJ6_9FUNG|nr:hypothetical protein LRAMOSA10389 [Lichtheimia ramosa]
MKTRVYMVSSFMALGGFLFGYQFGVLPGILTMYSFHQDTNIQDNSTSLTSTLMAGAVAGALAAGVLADLIGRRGVIAVSAALFMGADVLQVGADDIIKLYVGRAITGISIGALSMVVPLYQSEISPKEMRGRLVSIQQFAIACGICVSYWVDYAVLDATTVSNWRLAFGLPLIPALIYLAGALVLPKSPRYLIYKHHDRQALEVLAFVRGDGTINHPDVLMEYVEIKQSIRFEEKYGSKHFWRLFRKGADNNRKRLLLGMAVQIFQQLTGANALLLYAPLIFRASGIQGKSTTLLANGISGLVNLIFTIPPMITIDRWGRRPTLIVGSIACCLCLIIMTVIAAVTGLTDNIASMHVLDASDTNATEMDETIRHIDHQASIGFLVMMYMFVACYALTWGPAGWIYPTELYSQDVRARALGFTTAANWLFNFGVTMLTPLMYVHIQWKAFVVYAVFCFVMAIVVHRYFPETMGKSLEEVDLIFSGNFNYYDLSVHHPQTAAAALSQLNRTSRSRNALLGGFNQLVAARSNEHIPSSIHSSELDSGRGSQ